MIAARVMIIAGVCISADVLVSSAACAAEGPQALRLAAANAMKRAATFYAEQVASHGGYVYHYSPDLSRRWGEGEATEDQIWVQPPGTPTVGLAYLQAFEATGDRFYLDAAQAAAEALLHGQLVSGGWTNCVDFNPRGSRTAQYRKGQGRGKNNSSLDDGQTQSAIELLVRVDAALEFRNPAIHEAAQVALNSLLAAQYPIGAFPQVWTGPVSAPTNKTAVRGNYPDYDWRTEGKIKEYWNLYTLNDDLAVDLTQTLLAAHEVYGEPRYLEALTRLGDFLIVAQMPAPQSGWAQQYNYALQPVWARRFEPPAVSGLESQGAVDVLMQIYRATGDGKYLEPIPAALDYLKRSLLADGRLARYYELRSNRPLYMHRSGDQYSLTYSDADLPSHYGWQVEASIAELEAEFRAVSAGQAARSKPVPGPDIVRGLIEQLDEQGRWLSRFDGGRLVGQLRLPVGAKYISSEVFSQNLRTLAEFVATHRDIN